MLTAFSNWLISKLFCILSVKWK